MGLSRIDRRESGSPAQPRHYMERNKLIRRIRLLSEEEVVR